MVRSAALTGLVFSALLALPASGAETPLCPNVVTSGASAVAPKAGAFPALDQVTRVEVGQPMIFRGLVGEYPLSIKLPTAFRWVGKGSRPDTVDIPAGEYRPGSTYGDHIRYPVGNATITGPRGEDFKAGTAWLVYNRSNRRTYLFWDRGQGFVRVYDVNLPAEAAEIAYCQTPASGGFSSQIDYSGKSKDEITLTYREFSDGWSRPAFSQELKYDLSEGNEFAFRGSLFEILNATNTEITYRVTRPLE